MRTLLSRSPGGPETLVLTEVPDPIGPAAEEILVRVKACGVNFLDTLMIQDKYQVRPPRPFAPGCEAAGIVESVGSAVTNFKVDDRVLVWSGWGGMAEKLVVRASRCALIPESMPFDEAAVLLITYGTTYHAFKHRAKLRQGESLLVLGAAGGVGFAAIQLGKYFGARVIAAASSEEKVARARAMGADASVIYPSDLADKERAKAFTEALKQVAGPKGIDVIYDPVGGDYAEPALRAIAWKGRYLVVGFAAGIPRIPLNLLLLKGCDVLGVYWGNLAVNEPVLYAESVRACIDLHQQGVIQPKISARFPLERGGEAIASLASRSMTGKAVVVVD